MNDTMPNESPMTLSEAKSLLLQILRPAMTTKFRSIKSGLERVIQQLVQIMKGDLKGI